MQALPSVLGALRILSSSASAAATLVVHGFLPLALALSCRATWPARHTLAMIADLAGVLHSLLAAAGFPTASSLDVALSPSPGAEAQALTRPSQAIPCLHHRSSRYTS